MLAWLQEPDQHPEVPALLRQALYDALNDLPYDWEVILVDDGSADTSADILRQFVADDPLHFAAVIFRRNFGQTAAIAAGIDNTRGDVIVLMDADLQNDPADIPMLMEKINEGYDVVSGWRVRRQDTFLTRTLPSRIANALISRVTRVKLHDYGCTLKAYRREVLTNFRLYGEMHRFIPAYAGYVGAKIIEVPVRHHPRQYGQAKYGLERTFKVILDLFTVKFLISYANKPIYLFGGTGMALMGIGALALLFLFIRRIFYSISVFSSPIFPAALMFMVMGFYSILMGFIAELLVRTYHEAQRKPTYHIREIIRGEAETD
ncbi:MAG TPA: glycosyltransferase [Anaerolineales bacterium]|nr:glycosyltransferase [Anaerolineales bacterium]